MSDNEKILDIKGKSEDDFEKNITYISAGTLVLSLTFLEKIVSLEKASFIWALKWSWISLAITLLVNLASHQLASWFGDLAYMELRRNDPKHEKKVNRRNVIMRCINLFTILSLMLGISFLITFSTKNAYRMSNTSNKDQGQQLQNDPNFQTRGRTYTPGNSTGNSGGNNSSTQSGTSSGSTSNGGNNSGTSSSSKKG